MEEDERAVAAAEVARSGDLYQSQRTPVTMATKLDFFFQVFSALLAGAHSPETGGSGVGGGSGKGGSTEETAAVAAAQAEQTGTDGTEKEGSEGEKRRERTGIEKVGETLTNGDRGSQ